MIEEKNNRGIKLIGSEFVDEADEGWDNEEENKKEWRQADLIEKKTIK